MWQVAHYGDTGRAGNTWRPQEMDACAHLGIDLEHPEPVTPVTQLIQVTPVTPVTSVTLAASAASAASAAPGAYDSLKALEFSGPVEPVAATFQEARHYDTQVASKPEEREEPELPRPDRNDRNDRNDTKGKPRVIVWGNFPSSKR